MPNDDRMMPAPVGSREGYDLALTNTGVVMPERLGDMVDFAKIMAKADVAIPKHLRGNPGACLAVAMRARAWSMDPFAVATKTYAVNDILAYESQLITAVINKHSPVKGRLVPRFVGSGGDRQCILEPETHDGQLLPYESPRVKDIGVKNSPLWKNDPDQQLFYSSARAWARRYFPDLLLGVYDPDEARTMRDVTPPEERKVDNFLEDEGEIPPHRVLKEVSNPVEEIITATVNMETGEIEEVENKPQPVPPEIIAANMMKAAKGFTSITMLDAWWTESAADLEALPAGLAGEVTNAVNAARNDLNGL